MVVVITIIIVIVVVIIIRTRVALAGTVPVGAGEVELAGAHLGISEKELVRVRDVVMSGLVRAGEEHGEVGAGFVGGDDGGDGRARWHVGVDEVGAGAGAAHGAGRPVVGQRGLLGRVEGAEPVALLGGGVAYLGRVPAPRPAPDAEEPVCC